MCCLGMSVVLNTFITKAIRKNLGTKLRTNKLMNHTINVTLYNVK